jgi:hypothetical protein
MSIIITQQMVVRQHRPVAISRCEPGRCCSVPIRRRLASLGAATAACASMYGTLPRNLPNSRAQRELRFRTRLFGIRRTGGSGSVVRVSRCDIAPGSVATSSPARHWPRSSKRRVGKGANAPCPCYLSETLRMLSWHASLCPPTTCLFRPWVSQDFCKRSA